MYFDQYLVNALTLSDGIGNRHILILTFPEQSTIQIRVIADNLKSLSCFLVQSNHSSNDLKVFNLTASQVLLELRCLRPSIEEEQSTT